MQKSIVKPLFASIVIASFLNGSLLAEPSEPCEQIIKAFEVEIEKKDNVIQAQLEYAALLEKQRDKAYKLAEEGIAQPIPWYVWAIVGAGAGVTTMCIAGGCR